MILIQQVTDEFEGNYQIAYVHFVRDIDEAKRFLIKQYGSLDCAKAFLAESRSLYVKWLIMKLMSI